jgi:hypothetical protein
LQDDLHCYGELIRLFLANRHSEESKSVDWCAARSGECCDTESHDPTSIFHRYHKTRAQTEALVTILAILRFNIAKGYLPEKLDELISNGYLKAVPSDPYSSGPLVYKRTEDNFKIYSVGEDFSDDGGVIEVVNTSRKMPGFRGTTIIPHVHSPDIVYWPFEEFKKLRHEFSVEEAKRLKAEREQETRRQIEEPNQAGP